MKHFLFTLLFCLPLTVFAQNLYIDPAVVGALTVNGNMLEGAQLRTDDRLQRIGNKQTVITATLYSINNTQEMIYKGLSEVNSVVSNATSLQRTYSNMDRAVTYSQEAISLAAGNPHYLALSTKQLQRIQQWSVQIYADISSVVDFNTQNLMSSGDRKRLLDKIERDTYQLLISAIVIRNQLRRINRVGFLSMINPFDNAYSNRDLQIFNEFMSNENIK